MLQKIILILLFNILRNNASKITEFITEPLGVYSLDDYHPDVVLSYFYLQQRNIHVVDVVGLLRVKKPIYNLTSEAKTYLWTGLSYRSPSGDAGRINFRNACDAPFVQDILFSYEPKNLFDRTSCSFQPGNFTSSFNVDEAMHKNYKKFSLGKTFFTLNFSSEGEALFGLAMEMESTDLNLYKYTIMEYMAEPLGVYPEDDYKPDTVTYDFYLQQRTMHIVDVMGKLNVKKPMLNLTSEVLFFLSTGSKYVNPSGDSGHYEFPNACEAPFIGDILVTYKPKKLFDPVTCSFQPGNLTARFNVDELMHRRHDLYDIGKSFFTFNFSTNGQPLFGLSMEMETFDLELYKYTRD